jgi:hypothetical protein
MELEVTMKTTLAFTMKLMITPHVSNEDPKMKRTEQKRM